MEHFCIDPSRPKYEAKTQVKVLADVLWFDEGHKRAKKGEYVRLDAADLDVLTKAGQVEKVA